MQVFVRTAVSLDYMSLMLVGVYLEYTILLRRLDIPVISQEYWFSDYDYISHEHLKQAKN